MDSTFSDTPLLIDVALVPEFSNLTLGTSVEPFRAANRSAGQSLFTWRILSSDGAPVRSSSGLAIEADAMWDPDARPDILFLLASDNARSHATSALDRYLRALYRNGVMICGFDSAPWLLARAGLLDGARATTHWEDLEEFQDSYPRIQVSRDRFVGTHKVATTAGSLASFDFALDLLRQRAGLKLAMTVSGLFLYGQERPGSDLQEMVSVSQIMRHSPLIAQAIRQMEHHIEEPLSLGDIAGLCAVSERHLSRLFEREIAQSPMQYYRSLRLEVGKRMLMETRRTVLDVALACGFDNRTTFARAFRKQFLITPRECRTGMGTRS